MQWYSYKDPEIDLIHHRISLLKNGKYVFWDNLGFQCFGMFSSYEEAEEALKKFDDSMSNAHLNAQIHEMQEEIKELQKELWSK